MTAISSTGRVLRGVAFLTVLGFLTVVLVGPVLALVLGILGVMVALVAVVLPFALIGLLVWSVSLAVSRDRRAAWDNLRGHVVAFIRWVVTVPLAAGVAVCGWGIAVGRALAPKAVPVARRAGEVAREGVEKGVVLAGRGADAAGACLTKARSVSQFAGAVLLEVVGGAAVGTILVCLADSTAHGSTLALHILAGAVAGACLGMLVGATRWSLRPERG